ncbi:unnamed protein product [Rhizophagus irregularis]|uniref:PiggyBac transposable element-derived protein domain-containing protein n=1 Tax=Rhizophagus irregularis TaxID=588596 RepID=A0A2I1HK08_9GLOM|nr:hypothetical protein RhiirA4_481779 [Rhizophagus irregularis]CAB4446666.1 unnamed protein product [Rhizophagus irregularis]
MFTSRVKASNVAAIINVNKTGTEVYYLASQLSVLQKAFNIFIDNYFSSINLFSFFCEKDISAYGIVQTNTLKYPVFLKKEKEKKNEWDFLTSVVVDDVLDR